MFRSHISVVCRISFYHIWDLRCIHHYPISFYHIWDLRCIHHYLDLGIAKLRANALVSSRLDYCNSLLCGIADSDLTKLQCKCKM